MTTIFSLFLFTILFTVPRDGSSAAEDPLYATCVRPFRCGDLKNVEYPFWGGEERPAYCGRSGFKLKCLNNNLPVIDIGNQSFKVLSINQSRFSLRLARLDLSHNVCLTEFPNTTTFNNSVFHSRINGSNFSIFYRCPPDVRLPAPNNFTCTVNGSNVTNFYGDRAFVSVNPSNLSRCRFRVDVLVRRVALESLYTGAMTLEDALNDGFDVDYETEIQSCLSCRGSGGICGSNSSWPELACLCPDGPRPLLCLHPGSGGKRNWVLKTIIGIVATLFGMGAMAFVAFLYFRRKKNQYVASSLLSRSRSISSNPSAKMDSEKGGNYPGVHIFSYNELEEATNNFDSAKELGDGGFGTVYHGKLRDGRYVAVKRLYENNYRRLEQFMNEVEILTRLRHQNLVSLYGCTSRHSRELLLVYEYVPNGTVADHLHGDLLKSGSLTWPIRMSIAIETANALTYLHASDIIHRDVKTTNILLDNNFCVKVADFGLSRLFPTDVTHISTAPQGTPGYVDPEYHQCYQLTDKSDVYSFGVVLIELISSKPAVDITRHRHEINLSSMAISKIQNHTLHELVDPSLGFEKDDNARKMIAAVAELAFQCLQSEKEMRPSMEEVLEGLKRIQCEAHKTEKAGEMEMQGDDAVLLKSKVLTLSPDTVTVNWTSRSTTPNASS